MNTTILNIMASNTQFSGKDFKLKLFPIDSEITEADLILTLTKYGTTMNIDVYRQHDTAVCTFLDITGKQTRTVNFIIIIIFYFFLGGWAKV